MFHRMLFIFILSTTFTFLAWAAQAIDCSDTLDNDGCYEHPECCIEAPLIHICDPKVNGDCSQEGINMLSDMGIYITIVNGESEYECDDTSCHCEWQDCYVPAAETPVKMGE